MALALGTPESLQSQRNGSQRLISLLNIVLQPSFGDLVGSAAARLAYEALLEESALQQLDTRLLVALHVQAAVIADHSVGEQHARQAVSCCESIEDKSSLVLCLIFLALHETISQKYLDAVTHYDRALQLEQLDSSTAALVLQLLADALLKAQQTERAVKIYQLVHQLIPSAWICTRLADILLAQHGDAAAAQGQWYCVQAIEMLRHNATLSLYDIVLTPETVAITVAALAHCVCRTAYVAGNDAIALEYAKFAVKQLRSATPTEQVTVLLVRARQVLATTLVSAGYAAHAAQHLQAPEPQTAVTTRRPLSQSAMTSSPTATIPVGTSASHLITMVRIACMIRNLEQFSWSMAALLRLRPQQLQTIPIPCWQDVITRCIDLYQYDKAQQTTQLFLSLHSQYTVGWYVLLLIACANKDEAVLQSAVESLLRLRGDVPVPARYWTAVQTINHRLLQHPTSKL